MIAFSDFSRFEKANDIRLKDNVQSRKHRNLSMNKENKNIVPTNIKFRFKVKGSFQ